MAKKRYQITFTETTHKLICSLEKYGHNVRDILNAGIVLYDQSDNPARAMAEMRANCNLDEEVENLKRRLVVAEKARTDYIIGAGRMDHIVEGSDGSKGPESKQQGAKHG